MKEPLTQLKAWDALKKHRIDMQNVHMRGLFEADPQRFERFSLEAAGLYLDYSKHRITAETHQLLVHLAEAAGLGPQIGELFGGGLVNFTQNLPASHTSLRDPHAPAEVQAALQQMETLAHRIHAGQLRGFSGKVITDVVNIGIGGSDLGPRMVVDALQGTLAKPFKLRCHFVSNMDPVDMMQVLGGLDPERTLFIVTSKSFLTHETQQNMQLARQWLGAESQQFIAVTAHPKRAKAQGIPDDQILLIPETVGGRFSLWSAAGFSIVLVFGMPVFRALLSGAHDMDRHFQSAPFKENMPIILALIGIWYINFWGARSHAILPYSQSLRYLYAYLQQLDMESNGKQVNRAGEQVDYDTGPIIWGGVGSNSQHAFHQQLLQGAGLVPIDFIAVINNPYQNPQAREQQHRLLANCFSQSHALLYGRQDNALSAHKRVPGNAPSSTILMPYLTPTHLGALLALYEHKIFVQSAIWNINAFDQWGVELGKQLAENLIDQLREDPTPEKASPESATQGLINYFKRHLAPQTI